MLASFTQTNNSIFIIILILQLKLCWSSPLPSSLNPFKFISLHSKLNTNQIIHQSVWTFQHNKFKENDLATIEREDDDGSHQCNIEALSRFYPILVIPLLRYLTTLCRPPSIVSVGVGVTCGLGYYVFQTKHAEAKGCDTNENKFTLTNKQSSQKLPLHVVVGRVVMFWRKVAPIIIHYKFATFWMKRIKFYDKDKRDVIYDTLHERYAIQAKDVASEMKGMYIYTKRYYYVNSSELNLN